MTIAPRTLGLVLSLVLACSGPGAIPDCVEGDGVTPICGGFANPEDLAPLPGGSWLVVSQLREPGSLVAYRPSDGRRLDLYPGGVADSRARSERWGDPECEGPPDPEVFSPHGIDADLDGRRLAVVNHGGRETVELFEIGRSRRGPALFWRGCVVLPPDAWPNDVALLRNGGFVVTQMMASPGPAQALSLLKMLLGRDTGQVLEWQPESGLAVVPDSAGSGPNGIAVSRDGREIFFSEWSGGRLVRLRRHGDGRTQRTSVALTGHLPDNLTWTRDGRLLVTAQRTTIGGMLGCRRIGEGTCAVPFSVFEVEPATFGKRLLLAHDASATGAGSVALERGSKLWIGSCCGDRLGRAERGR